jgi:hypothetical protein
MAVGSALFDASLGRLRELVAASARIKISRAWLFGLGLWAACLFCAAYVGGEDPAYYWDWGGYYDQFRHYGHSPAVGDWRSF